MISTALNKRPGILFALLYPTMLLNKPTKKARVTRGIVRLNSTVELKPQTHREVQDKNESFLGRSYHSATHIRSYRHSYPDGPVGNYPGL
jgi:hypothetical protein